MTLNLNYQQRINLVLLVGAQRGNVAEMRLFWGLQDRLELNDEEKRSIDYRVELDGNGFEQPRWNFVKARDCAPLAYELSEAEAQRVRRMIEDWPHFLAAVDRVWIEPLIEQLPSVAVPAPAPAMPGMRM
jgi:hypothetical protein